MKNSKHKSQGFNLVLLISTLISSFLVGLGMHYYHAIAFSSHKDNPLYMPLVMAVLLVVFLIVTSLVVFLISNIRLTYRADVITGRNSKGRFILYLAIGILLIGLIMLGAEFLYEMNFQKDGTTGGTYMFLIDDSSSMDFTDPSQERYRVIEDMLKTKSDKTQYCVYSFSDNVNLCTPMQSVADGFDTYQPKVIGLTIMKTGLEKIIEDYEQGLWTIQQPTSLILITDGAPTDFSTFSDIKPVLDRYLAQNITIGIVGVYGADNILMENVATYTGGTFTDISNASMIGEAVQKVTARNGRTRDLLSVRDTVEMDWLYALIRILAFAVAGFLIAIVSALCYGNNLVFNFIVWTNTIKSILAGVLMEVAFLVPAHSTTLRMVAWILLGTIIARYSRREDPVFDDTMGIDFFDGPSDKAQGFSFY